VIARKRQVLQKKIQDKKKSRTKSEKKKGQVQFQEPHKQKKKKKKIETKKISLLFERFFFPLLTTLVYRLASLVGSRLGPARYR
jgi:hypothetical protein